MKQHFDRGLGVLMPISALPSAYGMGTLGKESYNFADFLKRIGGKYWQVLPVGPTSFGDSPYQSFSAFAGNPYFIDLEYLIKEQLLMLEEVEEITWQQEEGNIDYSIIYDNRFQVLRLAFERSNHRQEVDFLEFCKKSQYWLEDYALFMALKSHFNNHPWTEWEEDIKYREEEAVEKYSLLLEEDIEFWKFCQFKFREQWDNLKKYTKANGILIIGDIPLYTAMDSADVWVHGELFELDERKKPINVAGVPPDLFSSEGQRWGNPLYRWDVMEEDDFKWWRERMKTCASLYDIIRIDHFIGVVNYYSIPVECKTAVDGKWMPGPGHKLTEIIKDSIGDAKIIAEDLGILTPKVKALIEETGYPGMKVIEFGLDGPVTNDYLPHNYTTSNIVAYTGTHDNETLVGFLESKPIEHLKYLCRYFVASSIEELPDAIIRTLYSCIADVAIVQMQDLLKLNNKARINFPSTVGTNWMWRMTKEQYKEIEEAYLLDLAELYGRA